MPNQKEICICAALRLKDGRIFRGHRHHDCFHALSSRKIKENDAEQGFVTSLNRFVDRKEGLKLQKEAGIPSADKDGYRYGDLYSEDLY